MNSGSTSGPHVYRAIGAADFPDMLPRTVLALALAVAALAPHALGRPDDVAGDSSDRIGASIRVGKISPPTPPEIEVSDASAPRATPPWTPLNGRRARHLYYYYPGFDVFYRTEDGLWFFRDGRAWRTSVTLPPAVPIDFTRSVAVAMDDERPYRRHRQVAAYYPSDYFARVTVRLDPRTAAAHVKPPAEAAPAAVETPDDPGES